MAEEPDFIGLNAISNMYIEMASQNGSSISNKEYLEMAVRMNPNSSDAWEALAMFYEISDRKPEAAEGLYLKALSLDPSNRRVLYNFGNFYEENKDYPNMLKYYHLAGERDDSDSYFRIALYYLNVVKDKKLGLEFYLKGVELLKIDIEPVLEGFNNKPLINHLPKRYKDFNHFELLELLESIPSPSESVRKIMKALGEKESIIVYKNKIRIFKRLKNILDCQICYEKKLNIDLTCGHEICVDCYKQIYKKNCPWCRIPSYFNRCLL